MPKELFTTTGSGGPSPLLSYIFTPICPLPYLTFQEYLAAVHVKEQMIEGALLARVADSWWHETIRLYAAQADATALISACLAGDAPSVPALTLAIECLEEARNVSDSGVRTKLETILSQWVEDAAPERRRVAAEVSLTLRLRQMVRIDEDTYRDDAFITHAEYQLFLDERRAVGHYHQPDHWVGDRFPHGQGTAPVGGVRPSDAVAFCDWLTQREPGEWRYRLPMAGELETKAVAEHAHSEGIAGFGYWVISGEEIVCARPPGSTPVNAGITLRRLLHQDLTRAAAAHARADAVALAPAHTFAAAIDPVLAAALNPADAARARAYVLVLARAYARADARADALAAALDPALDRIFPPL